MKIDHFDIRLDTQGIRVFGMTKREAHRNGVCISCHKPPTFYSQAGRKEYFISGLCEPCFDQLTDDED